MNDRPTKRFWHQFDALNGGDGSLLKDLNIGEPRAKRTRSAGTHPSEDDEQKAVIRWWDLACKGYGLEPRLLFAVPNGAKLGRDAKSRMIEMTRLKATGLRPGVLDLILAVPRGEYHGAFLEMKSMVGAVSPDQASFMGLIERQGYFTRACFGADEAMETIKGYLGDV